MEKNASGSIAAAKTAKLEQVKKQQGCSIKAYVQRMEGEIAKALPSMIEPQAFIRTVMTAISRTPALADTTPASFLGAMMTAAQLGLEPNTPLGRAYLLPYRNGRTGQMECQFQLGYKGMIELAYRSGDVINIQAHEVYSGDEFHYSLGLNPDMVHIPAVKDRGEVIAYYAVYKTRSGGFGFEVMSKDDVIQHSKRFSKSAGNGPWVTNFDEMAKKTVLKKALKYAPLSTDIAKAISNDESIKTEISMDMSDVPSADIVVDENGEIIEEGDKKNDSES